MNYIKKLKIDLNQFFSIPDLNKIEIKNLNIRPKNGDEIIKYKNEIIKNKLNKLIVESIIENNYDFRNFFIFLLNKQDVLNIDSPMLTFYYIQKVIRGPWPQGEDIIIKDGGWAYAYANEIIRRRWPKGEDAISQSPNGAFGYVREIIRKPWPQGEDAISRNADHSFYYARDFIKDRWPKGEPVIMNSIAREWYISFLKGKRYDTSDLENKYPYQDIINDYDDEDDLD
jgi:hypothetical protein